MLRITISFCLFLLFSLTVSAQVNFNTYEIAWSDMYHKVKTRNDVDKILASDDNGFYTYAEPVDGEFKISYFTYEPRMVTSKTFKENRKLKESFKKVLQMRNRKIYLINLRRNKNKTITLLAKKIKEKTLDLSLNEKIMSERSVKGLKKDLEDSYTFTLSSDSSKLLIRHLKFWSGKKVIYGYQVFDDDLNMLWSGEREFTIDLYDKGGFSFFLKNDGSVIQYRWEDVKNVDKERIRTAVIYSLNDYGTNLNKFVVRDEKYFFADGRLAENKQGELIFAGYYSHGRHITFSGYFYAKLNLQDASVEDLNYHAFSRELMLQGLEDRRREIKEKALEEGIDGFGNHVLRHVNYHENETVMLVSEEFYNTTYYINGQRGGDITYGEQLIVNINPEHQLDWAKKIDKEYPYFFTFYNGDSYLFFRRENNEIEGANEPHHVGDRGIFSMTILDALGNQQIIPLYEQTFRMPYIEPEKSVRIGSKVILIASGGLMQRVGVIDLNKRKS